MKLLFLCTSLEPGRDGVGDYTRQLADACCRRGHECAMLALHDPFVKTVTESKDGPVSLLRVPAEASWTEKSSEGQGFVGSFNPDWLSWQIVPYGFHPKGIIPDEAILLSRLGAGRKNHVLLHELWIGLSKGEPFKNRLWGRLQRKALERFLERISAVVLHTTNPTYQEVLKRQGWHATLLPLFGNIPVVSHERRAADARQWTGVIFGTVHPQFSPTKCFATLSAGAELSRRNLRILGVGRLGEYGEKMFAELPKNHAGRLEMQVLGEKSPQEVSVLLQDADFGIGTHPWALAGKSGAIAAMLDHGLPVIVPRDDWALRNRPLSVPSLDPLMIRLSEMPPELMAGRLSARRAPASRLDGIAAAFVNQLAAASSGHLVES
jgi:hypothetical protein